jgi:ubiquinone/menaquinone biosynthesis C-methylase UbiE
MINFFSKFADSNNQNSVSYKLRKKRFEFFINTLSVNANDKILDVGGTEATWIGTGFEKNVTLLNIGFPATKHPDFTYIVANACDMHQIADKSFDVAFSNSVIEHVGKNNEQAAFAKEVERVAKKYWVQTPYKHFPIEPHFLFPFFTYLPYSWQQWVGLRWKYSHLKRNNEDILGELSRLKLLSKKELQALFPGSKLITERFAGLTKSLIVYKK